MDQSAATSSESCVDTLKNVKLSDSFADNDLINPETIFVRKSSRSAEQLIIENNAITETSNQDVSTLQYPVITDVEVSSNNQVIDAVLPEVAPLNFDIINKSEKTKCVIIRPTTFSASL